MINISREALMLLITVCMLLFAFMIEAIISFINKKFNHNLSHRFIGFIDPFLLLWYFMIVIVFGIMIIMMLNII